MTLIKMSMKSSRSIKMCLMVLDVWRVRIELRLNLPLVQWYTHLAKYPSLRERERVKEELDHMEKLGVIRKAEQPTEWMSSLVVVEKPNGKVRLCLDPQDLNNAIQREHYPMQTMEEVR